MNKKRVSRKINYIRKTFANESPLLKEIDKNIRNNDLPIHLAPEEGKLIQVLLKMINAQKIVEVGTLAGYSTIWMAEILGPNGVIHTIEKDNKRYLQAKENFAKTNLNSKIILHHGDGLEVLKQLSLQSPFDAIFIDANKASYPEYLKWAEENIKCNGLIIADNTLLFGAVYGDNKKNMKPTTVEAMKLFNLNLSNPNKYQSIMIPTDEGLTIAIKLF